MATATPLLLCCILSKFYIKPQPCSERDFIRTVVSYRNSTSNHNFVHSPAHEVEVVSYRNSTSNHNQGTASNFGEVLYLIEILHQTTTCLVVIFDKSGCILSKFYIKPQLLGVLLCYGCSCILSKFYIKPQPSRLHEFSCRVVSYRNSTSNHNLHLPRFACRLVVSYRNSTSNHNNASVTVLVTPLYLIEILHQTTTQLSSTTRALMLYLIEILHQTTTGSFRPLAPRGCILSKFYIKPQHCSHTLVSGPGCILSKFYIKPQLLRRVC